MGREWSSFVKSRLYWRDPNWSSFGKNSRLYLRDPNWSSFGKTSRLFGEIQSCPALEKYSFVLETFDGSKVDYHVLDHLGDGGCVSVS